MCVLRERLDPSSGVIRWSLPKEEICFCHGVVTPKVLAGQSCLRYEDADTNDDLWFTDDPTSLTNRENWTPKKLDALLSRSLCCKCLFYLRGKYTPNLN